MENGKERAGERWKGGFSAKTCWNQETRRLVSPKAVVFLNAVASTALPTTRVAFALPTKSLRLGAIVRLCFRPSAGVSVFPVESYGPASREAAIEAVTLRLQDSLSQNRCAALRALVGGRPGVSSGSFCRSGGRPGGRNRGRRSSGVALRNGRSGLEFGLLLALFWHSDCTALLLHWYCRGTVLWDCWLYAGAHTGPVQYQDGVS